MPNPVRRTRWKLVWIVTLVVFSGGMPRDAFAQTIHETEDHVEWIRNTFAPADDDGVSVLDSPSKDPPVVTKVIGSDQREGVGNTTSFPWRTIGQTVAAFEHGDDSKTTIRGTGVLIGNRTVLTCAHVVVDNQRWPDSMTFAPAKNGSQEPYGVFRVDKKAVRGEYWYDDNTEYDLALLTLDSPVGEQTGYMVIDVKPVSFFENMTVNIAGYPGDLGSAELYFAAGSVTATSGNFIYHQVDTAGGQSGAPVWVYYEEEGGRQLVAIHTRGSTQRNLAIRLTQTFFDWINTYLKENDTVHYNTESSSDTTDDADRTTNTAQPTPSAGACGVAAPLLAMAIALAVLGLVRPVRRRRTRS